MCKKNIPKITLKEPVTKDQVLGGLLLMVITDIGSMRWKMVVLHIGLTYYRKKHQMHRKSRLISA